MKNSETLKQELNTPVIAKLLIDFANFIGNRPLPEYSKSTNKWRWWDNDKRDYAYATTEQLFEVWKNHLIEKL